MNKDDADDLINILISLLNGQLDLAAFKEILIPNYTDINGNSYFHFLTEYSFSEFCLRNMKLNKGKEIISFEKFNEIKSEYTQQIKSFIQTLLELNCDLFYVNNNNLSPLLLSIYSKNYIMTKEYLQVIQNIGIYTNTYYYDCLDIIIKNGNILKKDCTELINYILSIIDCNNNMEIDILKIKTMIISLSKNYSQSLYEKYNEIIRIVSLEYINKNNNNNIILKQDENDIQNIKKKSFEILNDYINNNFLPLLTKLVKLGGNLEYKRESAFIYLMFYPFIPDLPNYIVENNVDLNFQDDSGNTPLISLINNKEHIIQISKDIYDKTFQYLLDNKNLDISKKDINGKTVFSLCLIKDYYEEAKIIYNKLYY